MPEIPSIDDCLAAAVDYLNPPDEEASAQDAMIANAWLNLANVQAQKVAMEQLRLQRLAIAPIEAMVALIEEIAAATEGQWDARRVNGWIAQAVKIDREMPQ